MITAETSPLYLEGAVAAKLGYSRDDIRLARRAALKKEEGWTTLGREVVYTLAALQALLAHLSDGATVDAVDFADCLRAGPEKKNGALEAAHNDVVTLLVKRILPNRRLLTATDQATGAERTVRVPDNTNFRPRMQLRAKPADGNFYALEGRCPRTPGRY